MNIPDTYENFVKLSDPDASWQSFLDDPERQKKLADKICRAALDPNPSPDISRKFRAAAVRAFKNFRLRTYYQARGRKIEYWTDGISFAALAAGAGLAAFISAKAGGEPALAAETGGLLALTAVLVVDTKIRAFGLRTALAKHAAKKFGNANEETVHAGFRDAMTALFRDNRLDAEARSDKSLGDGLVEHLAWQKDVDMAALKAVAKRMAAPWKNATETNIFDVEAARTARNCAVKSSQSSTLQPT